MFVSAEQGVVAELLPSVCPRSARLLPLIYWQESQSPHYGWGGEGRAWLQMTSALVWMYCCSKFLNF